MYVGEAKSHKDASGARLLVCAMDSEEVSIDLKIGERNVYMLTYPLAEARALHASIGAAIQAAESGGQP